MLPRFVRGRAGSAAAGRVRRRRAEPQLAALGRLEELMGDLGLPDARGARDRVRRRRRGLGGPHRRAQHRDVDEGRRQAGLVHRGLRRAARGSGRLHGAADRRVRAATAPRGTWYAHASVGCLHVRPILNLKQEQGVRADARDRRGGVRHGARSTRARTRASTATASCARSSTRRCSAPRLVRAFEEVKDSFDPDGLFNPGKIVRAPRMDDRSLLRYPPGYARAAARDRRSTGAPGAAFSAPPRCATTTAPAASPQAA